MPKPLVIATCVSLTQSASVALGIAWGLGGWLHGRWAMAGELAVALLGLELLRSMMPRRLSPIRTTASWLCVSLTAYALGLMYFDAFVWLRGDEAFVLGVLMLLPFLLAQGLLIRLKAWLGVAGSGVFYATSLAMLIRNGFSMTSGSGFFVRWVT